MPNFEIPKIGDVFDPPTATSGVMPKWMSRGDSAHQIGLVCDSQGVSDCSGGLSRVGNYARAQFGIPKIGTFWLVGPSPMVRRQNGWHEEIQRIN